jgi:hypothetical protein
MHAVAGRVVREALFPLRWAVAALQRDLLAGTDRDWLACMFPPIVDGGAFRPFAFARYLPEFGYSRLFSRVPIAASFRQIRGGTGS